MKTLIYFLSIDSMKTLTQHIEEKLRINKDWVPAKDFTDFDNVKEVMVVAFDEQDRDWFVSKYEITEIDRRDNEDGTVYHIYADSNSHGEWNDIPAAWLPEYKILFYLGRGYKYVMVHPNDKERLESLYNHLFNGRYTKSIRPADPITVDNLLGEYLGITDYSYFYTSRGDINMLLRLTSLDIADAKKDLEEMMK